MDEYPNAVTIAINGSKLVVSAPYNPRFVELMRQLGGVWKSSVQAWALQRTFEKLVRNTCNDIFGTDQAEYESVIARFSALDVWRSDSTGNDYTMYFAGRKILSRERRDDRIKIYPGVSVVSGVLPRTGGSVKNPSLAFDQDVTVEVMGVPTGHGDLRASYVEVVKVNAEENAEERVTALMSEREKLISRLSEIDAEIDALAINAVIDALG